MRSWIRISTAAIVLALSAMLFASAGALADAANCSTSQPSAGQVVVTCQVAAPNPVKGEELIVQVGDETLIQEGPFTDAAFSAVFTAQTGTVNVNTSGGTACVNLFVTGASSVNVSGSATAPNGGATPFSTGPVPITTGKEKLKVGFCNPAPKS